MTTSHPFAPFDHLPQTSGRVLCPIRNEIDVVAATVHTLGFWPQNSLALFAFGNSGVGPLIRVDLPDPQEGPEGYLEHFLRQLPVGPGNNDRLDRIIAIFFCDREGTLPGTDPTTYEWFTTIVRPEEEEFISSIQSLIAPLQKVTAACSIDLMDAIAVGQENIWALEHEDPHLQRTAPISAVRASDIYREMLALGSQVAASHSQLLEEASWNPLETGDAAARDGWLSYAELAARHYLTEKADSHTGEMRQIYAELRVWDAALTRCARIVQEVSEGPQEGKVPAPAGEGQTAADLIRREIPQDAAAYLIASFNSTATLQLVIYLACGELTPSLHALAVINRQVEEMQGRKARSGAPVAPLPETLAHYGLTGLSQGKIPPVSADLMADGMENMAVTLSGKRTQAPDPYRLTALGTIASLLEHSAHGKPESLLKMAQAWVCWLQGKSSTADALLSAVPPEHYGIDPTLLHFLLQAGELPAWLPDLHRAGQNVTKNG